MTINILEYLEHSASLYPDKVAIADEKHSATFFEWNATARSIGTAIAETCNHRLRNPILIFVDRRIEGLVGFMGVVESGNFYVPIDCKMPYPRVKLIYDILNPIAAIYVTEKDNKILDDIQFEGARFRYDDVITTPANEKLLKDIRTQMIDTDPLYVIFTSGSTGVPKGVVISHRGVIDLAEWLVGTFGFTNDDILGNQAPFYFDGSVKDIYITLKTGSTLNIIGKKYFTFPKLLIKFLNDRRISNILWATSAIVLVGNSDILSISLPLYLKRVFFAGEAMPAKQLKVWRDKLPGVKFINLYGPTEITVDCTYYEVDREFDDNEFIPIGKPCTNMQVLVFDDNNELVKQGEAGELCVRGTGVALGYYNNKEKTQQVFVQNPLHNLYRDIIYRTGDIVKYDEQGDLEFISRKDFQVKHMGYRIELGEIEVTINSYPEISNAACIFDEKHDEIVLFYTTIDGKEADIFNEVKEKLPKYMMPGKTIFLKEMPYNMNDKIDRVELKRMYETQQN